MGYGIPTNTYPKLQEQESIIDPFLKPAIMETQPVYAKDRFPNIIVAMDGTVIAAWNGVQVRRSEDGGKSWGAPILIAEGFMGGGFTVDEISGDILAFVEDTHPPAPLHIYRSSDHGLTWKLQPTEIYPNSLGHVPSMSMNEHGITLRRGDYKGRLIRPSRWYARRNYPPAHFPTHYTNAIFSDDGGRTWQASEPFPLMGTGEACIAELSDGTLYYNSRRHWAPTTEDALWRWEANSADGGMNWINGRRSEVLPDGDRARAYGLMGGMVRLPIMNRDILLFSNIVSPEGRKNGFVWVSFDGGDTWPLRRQVTPGTFAYSAMNAGRPGTPSEGWIYLFYEGETKDQPAAGSMARFNLSWMLEGEPTGNGEVPEWIKP